MFFEIKAKISFLESCYGNVQINRLTKVAEEMLQETKQSERWPQGFINLVGLNSIYCLLKHWLWQEVPIFRELMIEYLGQDSFLGKSPSEKLFSGLRTAIAEIFPEKIPLMREDKEFLRYILVKTVSLDDLNSLVMDLGFGESILRRLKNIVLFLSRNQDQEKTELKKYGFFPEIDQKFAEVLAEFSAELKDTPWISDIYNLYYLLLDKNQSPSLVISLVNARTLFEVLLYLGKNSGAKPEEISKIILRMFPVGSDDKEKKLVTSIFNLLGSCGLIYSTQGTSKKGLSRWYLSEIGEELTARGFYYTSFVDRNCTIEELLALNPAYQSRVISGLPEEMINRISEFISNPTRPLSPKGLKTVVQRLSKVADHRKISDDLKNIVRSSRPSAYRCAACQAMLFLDMDLQTEEELMDILVKDQSENVKESLLQILVEKRGAGIFRDLWLRTDIARTPREMINEN